MKQQRGPFLDHLFSELLSLLQDAAAGKDPLEKESEYPTLILDGCDEEEDQIGTPEEETEDIIETAGGRQDLPLDLLEAQTAAKKDLFQRFEPSLPEDMELSVPVTDTVHLKPRRSYSESNLRKPALRSKKPIETKHVRFRNSIGDCKVFDRLSSPRAIRYLREVALNECSSASHHCLDDGRALQVEKVSKLNHVEGTVLVRNLAYEKKVSVRYTFNNWRTYDEVVCSYIEEESAGIDRFGFQIIIRPGGTLCFAVRYDVNGTSYWDNNAGRNYEIHMKSERVNPDPDFPFPPSIPNNFAQSSGRSVSLRTSSSFVRTWPTSAKIDLDF